MLGGLARPRRESSRRPSLALGLGASSLASAMPTSRQRAKQMSFPIFGGLLPAKPREALRDAVAG